jgi:hypothetical protein
MMEYDKKIKKLNILEKLLKKPLVQVKKTLGDKELVGEVNEEIRQFILAQIEVILNAQVPVAFTEKAREGASVFTNDELTVLKGLASRVLSKVATPKTEVPTVDLEAKPPEDAPPAPVRKAVGPVWQALQNAGYDPDTFKSMSVEERRNIMKELEGKGK